MKATLRVVAQALLVGQRGAVMLGHPQAQDDQAAADVIFPIEIAGEAAADTGFPFAHAKQAAAEAEDDRARYTGGSTSELLLRHHAQASNASLVFDDLEMFFPPRHGTVAPRQHHRAWGHALQKLLRFAERAAVGAATASTHRGASGRVDCAVPEGTFDEDYETHFKNIDAKTMEGFTGQLMQEAFPKLKELYEGVMGGCQGKESDEAALQACRKEKFLAWWGKAVLKDLKNAMNTNKAFQNAGGTDGALRRMCSFAPDTPFAKATEWTTYLLCAACQGKALGKPFEGQFMENCKGEQTDGNNKKIWIDRSGLLDKCRKKAKMRPVK